MPRTLDAYTAKRKPGETPEPFGEAASSAGALAFVVQQHAARRLHWDLRLEHEGVLLSWAVPHGPSYDPADKRLAVRTEDHPIEYGDFEGLIPAGHYGAGAMIVWDRGRFEPLADIDEGLAKGKLLFDLQGHKLQGRWTLVRIKKEPKNWLLIKERDAWAGVAKPLAPESVLSGLTVEELRGGSERTERLRAKLLAWKTPRREVRPEKVSVMLAETSREPFSKPGWVFELKYDGYRLLAAKRAGPGKGAGAVGPPGQAVDPRAAALFYRSGGDATRVFPEIARAVAALPARSFILDGEAAVLGEDGKPVFQRLQARGQLRRAADIERGRLEHPVTLLAFDLLAFEDFDLRDLPLLERKEALRALLPPVGPLRYADHVEERGKELFDLARRRGIEGVMAKKTDSPYRGGRSALWLKVRADRTADLIVVGYTLPKGGRQGLGALHLAGFEGGELVYAGRAGTGFTDRALEDWRRRLEPRRRATPACGGPVPTGKEHVWVEPRLVVEVRYTEWTGDGLLRHPVFVRQRTDKKPRECTIDRSAQPGPPEERGVPAENGGPSRAASPAGAIAVSEPPGARGAAPPALRFTNLDKVLWPEEGYTKGDLINYYRTVAPVLLPYLRDRPLVLDRYPDGIAGKNFYQKNAAPQTPGWVRTAAIFSEESARDIDYFVCDSEAMLLYIANLAAIPLHIWASRLASLDRPDWAILDLDPKEASFADVVRLARAVHEICDDIGLPSFVKTSGSSGLHVLVPLGGLCDYAQTKQLAELVARVVARERPEIATVERVIGKRGGRVYVDFLQNGHGKLIAAPFCARPRPGAPVSAPLLWREVTAQLDPRKFTLRTMPRRLQKLGEDPLLPVLTLKPDLAGALARLAERQPVYAARDGRNKK